MTDEAMMMTEAQNGSLIVCPVDVDILFPDNFRFSQFPGSAFRGLFGHVFKSVSCLKDGDCEPCEIKRSCPYSINFESPCPEDAEMMRLYPNVPHPFTFQFSDWENIKSGAFTFRLTLFGDAIKYLPYYVFAFPEMGQVGIGKARQKFQLQRVREAGSDRVVLAAGDRTIRMPKNSSLLKVNSENSNNESPRTFRLNFTVPCKLNKDGSILESFESRPFVSSILRRLSALSHFYAGRKLDLDFALLCSLAEECKVSDNQTQPVSVERYSSRQKRKMSFNGFSGSVILRECPPVLQKLIKVGQRLHVGKATSFGFGHYMAEEISNA